MTRQLKVAEMTCQLKSGADDELYAEDGEHVKIRELINHAYVIVFHLALMVKVTNVCLPEKRKLALQYNCIAK